MEPSQENERLIRVATQEVERLNLLVEDFLILTMPIQKHTAPVDLGEVVSDTLDSFTKIMGRKKYISSMGSVRAYMSERIPTD